MEVAEAHPAVGQIIDVGRLDLAAKAADVRVPQVISHDKQDIRSLVGSFNLRKAEDYQYEYQSRYDKKPVCLHQ